MMQEKRMKNNRLMFRAWDPQKQCYYDDFFVSADGDGAMYSPLEEGEDENRLIIEQCTGLKDKKGALIFEGDILKVSDRLFVLRRDDYGLMTTVEDDNPFKNVIDWPDFVKEIWMNGRAGLIEKIGNIHENPELLEKA